jgi:enoyl-CoA hydratase/carnithine racemase
MSGPVSYRLDQSVAFITMDDGKVNVLGPSMQQALNEALDDADRDDVGAVVIAGNHRVFSGGSREFATLKQQAHTATKLRTRADALAGIRAGIDGMAAEFGL